MRNFHTVKFRPQCTCSLRGQCLSAAHTQELISRRTIVTPSVLKGVDVESSIKAENISKFSKIAERWRYNRGLVLQLLERLRVRMV